MAIRLIVFPEKALTENSLQQPISIHDMAKLQIENLPTLEVASVRLSSKSDVALVLGIPLPTPV